MTEFQIEVNLLHVPQGTPVELYGFGQFANGGTYDVPDELVQLYRINHPAKGKNEQGEEINVDPMDLLNTQEGIDFFRAEEPVTSTEETPSISHNDEVPSNQESPVVPLEDAGSANAPTEEEAK